MISKKASKATLMTVGPQYRMLQGTRARMAVEARDSSSWHMLQIQALSIWHFSDAQESVRARRRLSPLADAMLDCTRCVLEAGRAVEFLSRVAFQLL